MKNPKIVSLATKHIRIDGGTQTREEINESVVSEYADALKAGIQLPAAIVYHDGSNNWLADGFHRYHGANEAKKSLLCEVRSGTRRDAVRYAAGANFGHGLRRTNETKRRAVLLLLNDEEWCQWSDAVIANECHVSREFVRQVRAAQGATVAPSNGTRKGADGKNYPVNLANKPAHTSPPTRPATEPDEDFSDPLEDESFHGEGHQEAAIVETFARTENASVPASSAGYSPADEAGTPQEDMSPIMDGEAAPVTNNAESKSKNDLPANAEIIHDTLTQKQEADKAAPKEKETVLPDYEWLETLPIIRVLRTHHHRGITAARAALDYRKNEKAISAYNRAIASAESVKADDNNFFAKALSAPRSIKSPDTWGVCPPCRGAGCERCGRAGFDMLGGIDPLRIEAGELDG